MYTFKNVKTKNYKKKLTKWIKKKKKKMINMFFPQLYIDGKRKKKIVDFS